MAHVLLTGAGFSRNWGGWLATEAFEYLIGCSEIDEHLRDLLWKNKSRGGGFEDVIAELQIENSRGASENIRKQFREYLARASRLMIIGYSFSDAHINTVLIDAAKQRNIGIFIIDPLGVDVLNKQDPRHIQVSSELMNALQPRIIGASRRLFLSAFSTDRVEFDRLSRFFERS